jgi:hypothetical protein
MKIKNPCQVSYCLEFEIIEWDGGILKDFYCEKHKNKEGKEREEKR